MPQQIENVSIFIASPGGLDEERQAAYRIVQDINRANAKHWGCQLELVGWEETLPGHGRPQSIINRELDRCEYFIGLIYDHWGSPPSAEVDTFSSGFEEEFERARGHVASGKMKNIVLYLKEIPAARLRDPGASLKKVVEFRDRCFAEKSALYKEYADVSEFEDAVRGVLTEIGWAEASLVRSQLEPAASSEVEHPDQLTEAEGKTSKTRTTKTPDGVIAASANKFVSELLGSSGVDENPTNTSVARFRLIGCSIKQPGNDDEYLGNHDANILFSAREQHTWSNQEIRALIKCGIVGYADQNVPLWYWVELSKKMRISRFDFLDVLSVVGTEQEKPNAIRLSQMLNRTTPELDEFISREDTINDWLSSDSPSMVYDAAIKFFSTNGTLDDLPYLEVLLEKTEGNKKEELQRAIVSIQSATGQSKALEKVLEFELSDVGAELMNVLFSQPSSLTSETLRKCLAANDGQVRAKALALLNERRATSKEDAESLVSDSDYSVRLQAVEALHSLGSPLDEEATKKTLIKTKAPKPFNPLLISARFSDQTDSSSYDEYRLNRLSELSFGELKTMVDSAGPLLGVEISVFYLRFSGKLAKEIRANLSDGYEAFFKERLEELAKKNGGRETDLFRKIEKLFPSTKRRVTTDALKALCSLGKKDDLALVRDVIDKYSVDASEEVLSFLGAFGDWSDFERITALSGFPLTNIGILSLYKSGFEKEKASALLSISKKQIADLLSSKMENSTRKEVLLALTSAHLTKMSDEILLSELNRDIDVCRIILALQCCLHLPKRRLAQLLEKHVSSDDYRYYNTIHWLDAGVSLSRKVAKLIARQELSRLRNA